MGDRFHLQGSMNFTYFGQAVNAEGVTLTRDPHEIAEATDRVQRSVRGCRHEG